MNVLRRLKFEFDSLLYIGIIFLLPFYIAYSIQTVCPPYPSYFMIFPLVYFLSFVLILCGLGLLHRRHIVPGKMERSITCLPYAKRRLYGLCWTCLYYFTPAYHLVLTIPALKWMVFRAFGYKGSLDFALYADTWIRDLPLLDIGRGVYIANKATLGTNMPLINGKISVNKIAIGEGSLIGHLTKIGPGVSIGSNTEIATDCAIGISSRIGNNVRIGSCVTVEHYTSIGSNVQIGGRCYIGSRCKIGDNLKIPSGSIIPGPIKLLSQLELDRFLNKVQPVSHLYASRN